ncbi:MAG: ABC transporter ATP-binding protein [Candidatus Bathyarchaeota archaeon]|nr:ABC transporter ATP-binding protein [Candidatus Bathyarchaeum sp.]
MQSYPLKNGSLVNALDGVNLEVFKGEFLTVMGRSGSGKTTLLNLIGALNRPTSGEIMFEGKNLSNFSNQDLALLRREKIGFIFQTFNLLPTLTVFENVESALIHTTMSRNEIDEKIFALLKFFDLADKSSMLPHELSVGQQQKVAIARALVKDPLIIIADEPTGNMDPIAGKEIVTKLVELNHKSKITIVVASHGNFPRAEIDRMLFLKDGKIVSQD